MFGLGSNRRAETWTSWLGFKWWTAISMCLSWRDWGIEPSPMSGKMFPPQKIQVKKNGVSSGITSPLKDLFTRKNVSRTCCFLMYIVMTVSMFWNKMLHEIVGISNNWKIWIKYLNLLLNLLLDSIYLSSFHWLVDWKNVIFHSYLNCSCDIH